MSNLIIKTTNVDFKVNEQTGEAYISQRKAAELLGKRYALFTDKKQITGAVPVVIADDVTE